MNLMKGAIAEGLTRHGRHLGRNIIYFGLLPAIPAEALSIAAFTCFFVASMDVIFFIANIK